MARRAALVIDEQVDFCEGGSLAVQGGSLVAKNSTTFLRENKKFYQMVVGTKDSHIDPGEHFSDHPDYKNSWPVHCKDGDHGSEYHSNLDASLIDFHGKKGAFKAAYSGFEASFVFEGEPVSLDQLLQANEVDSVDIFGIATDHCVRATAEDALENGYAVRLLLFLCAGVDAAASEKAVADLRAKGAVIVYSLEDLDF